MLEDLLIEAARCSNYQWRWIQEWWDPFNWAGTGHWVKQCLYVVILK